MLPLDVLIETMKFEASLDGSLREDSRWAGGGSCFGTPIPGELRQTPSAFRKPETSEKPEKGESVV